MICSIKRNENNLEEILSLFAESNVMRLNDDDAHYIIVDVDSNTILYHPVLEKLFTECIVEPPKSVFRSPTLVSGSVCSIHEAVLWAKRTI